MKIKVNRQCFLSLVLALLFAQSVFAQAPAISSFLPESGTTGTRVTISGINFSPVAANNIVRFGSVKAVVQSASATTLVVTVPIGATFKPVTVTTNGLTAYATKPFLVTFPGADGGFSPGSFATKIDSVTGSGTVGVSTADFDNDGLTDMAVLNAYTNKVALYRNTSSIGTISFQPNIKFATGDTALGIAVEDLDGDGKQDIITANRRANTISILRNTSTAGTISFQAKIDFPAGVYPVAVAAGDFDKDGKPDIAVVNNGSRSVSLFRNISTAGAISFDAKKDITTGNNPAGIAIADVDGDTGADIAVTNWSDNTVSIYKNKCTPGNLLFDAKLDFPAFNGPAAVTAGDFDGDGRTDLAAVSSYYTTVSVLRNLGSGSTISFSAPTNYLLWSWSNDLSVADMDGDGKPDLVSVNYDNSVVSVLKNACTPGTILFNPRNDYATGAKPYGLSVADMDGDSKPDIVTANSYGASVSVLRNTVTLPYIKSFTPTTAGNGGIVSILGINFTGVTEVSFGNTKATSFTIDSATGITAVVDTGASGAVKVITNHGTATKDGFTFSELPTISSFTPASGGAGTVATITGTNFTNATNVIFGGTQAVSFQVLSPTTIVAVAGATPPGSMPVWVITPGGTASMFGYYSGAVIDAVTPGSGPVGSQVTITGRHFSNNAADNIVYFGAVRATVTSADTGTLQVMVPPGATYQPVSVTTNNLTAYSSRPFVVTFKGDHSGFTQSSFLKKLDSTAGYFPLQVHLQDLNNDGKADVISTNFSSGFSVLKNTSAAGNVSFARKAEHSFPDIWKTCVGDLDGDGKAEIVVLNRIDNQYKTYFSVLQNTSTTDISFAGRQDFLIDNSNNPAGGVIADFDGDGKADVAVAMPSYVALFRNTSTNGVISFAPKQSLPSYGFAAAVAASDIDGDGRVDLVVADNDVRVYRNISYGGGILFTKATIIQSGFSPYSLALGDLDNDGRTDIAVTHSGNNNVSILKNTSSAGSVSFAPNINFPLGINPYNVSINDLDGDGKPDLAVTIWTNNRIRLFKNTSTNNGLTFTDLTFYGEVALNYEMRDLISGDIDGDGRPDLVTANPSSNNISVFLNNIPDDGMAPATIKAMGATSFCQGGQVVLKTNEAVGASYQWYNNGAAINGATDSMYTAVSSGTYTVHRTIGATTAVSASLVVTMKPRPAPPTISVAGTPLCQGQNVLLTASSQANNQWYVNNILQAGISGNTLRADKSAVYTVTTTSNGCVSLPSAGAIVNFNTLPVVTVTPVTAAFCYGDSALLTANAAAGSGLQWNVNGTPIPQANGVAYAAKNTGNYTVAVKAGGCNSTSPVVSVTQKPVPGKPSITVSGNNLVSSAVNGNQWYLEGVAIAGATSQLYKPVQSGNYSVTVTDNGCIGIASEKYSFTVTGIIAIDNTQYIRLGPNPATDWLTVSFNITGVNALNIGMVDMEGRTIGAWKYIRSGDRLHVAGLSHGIYFVRIYTDNRKINYVLKVLKQ